MSNDSFWPSDNEVIPAASSAVAWTNTSLAPPSGAIKPKPLAELKNFTVPMVMMVPLRMIVPTDAGKAKTSSREVSGPGAREAGRDWRFFWSSRAEDYAPLSGIIQGGRDQQRAGRRGSGIGNSSVPEGD